MPRWTFDTKSSKCEKFIYGGCGGNDNNFETQLECEKKCLNKGCNQVCGVKYPPNWTGPKKTIAVVRCPKECPFCSAGGIKPPPNVVVISRCYKFPPPQAPPEVGTDHSVDTDGPKRYIAETQDE